MTKNIKKLQLNKETIAKLNNDSLSQVKGGALAMGNNTGKSRIWTFDGKCSEGCSDGCTGPLTFQTYFNCTNGQCTFDCYTNQCPTWTNCDTKTTK